MEALFQKDCIIVWKSNRILLALVLVFIVMAAINPDNMFFSVYPPIVLTAMSLNSLAADEKSGWLVYADTLPCGRKKIVASKYLLAGAGCLIPLLLQLIAYVVANMAYGEFDIERILWILCIVLVAGTAHAAIMLPISLRFGTEKGRIIYILCLCAFCATAIAVPMPTITVGRSWMILGAVAAACVVLWWISYQIAVALYQKRIL